MDKLLHGIILVVGMLIATFAMSFIFSTERPSKDKDFYKQVDEKQKDDGD